MTTDGGSFKLDPGNAANQLRQDAAEVVKRADGEVILDFSAIRKIDSDSVNALRELLELAEGRSVRIVLRGVDTAVYKVLRILDLTGRFGD